MVLVRQGKTKGMGKETTSSTEEKKLRSSEEVERLREERDRYREALTEIEALTVIEALISALEAANE